MNEQRFGKEVKGYLNQGLDLPDTQIERLRSARLAALAKQRVTPAWVTALAPAVATAGSKGSNGTFGNAPGTLLRWGLPVLLAAALLMGWQQWRSVPPDDTDAVAEAMADIDSELLKGDLPIKAYLDGGFREFLGGGE